MQRCRIEYKSTCVMTGHGCPRSQVKRFLDLCIAFVRILHTVTYGPRVLIDLVVIAALHCLVTEEVDGLVVHPSRHILVILNVLQAVCLVPACREDVEGDLTADGVAENR